MKFKLPFIFILLLILCVSCQEKIDQEKEDLIKQIYESMGESPNPDAEKVILLSFKYNLEENKVEKILDEYLSKYDEGYLSIKEAFEGKMSSKRENKTKYNIQHTIIELSSKYDISKDVLVSLIIDYIIWDNSEEGEY
ncbi:hypothetical protein LCGC14_1408020 [marine sediment metagenome]|uniref:Uncharacterized protein n=1 Tax=marine sediment metagenome TaxID=412755 RepID=A0A0F9JVC9_9ZZZZ|nr:hypothetical protein [Candidatus Aminicenantes bacterium]